MIPIEYMYLAVSLAGSAITAACYLQAIHLAKEQRHPRYEGI